MERYEIGRHDQDGRTDVMNFEETKYFAFENAKQLSFEYPSAIITIFDRLAHHGQIELWRFSFGKVISSERKA